MQWIWCLVLLQASLSYAAGGRRGEVFEVHGHRGARAREPENTLPAFEHALNGGANVLEADVGVSKDGHLVLNHDFEVNTKLCRSASPGLKNANHPLVNSLTLAQLKTYDCGSAYDAEFPERKIRPGARILTLGEFLDWLNRTPNPAGRLVRLNLETKIESAHPGKTVAPRVFVDMIARELKKHRISANRVILQSFDFRTIVYAKKKYPQYQTSALVEGDSLDVEKIWEQTRANYISPDANLLNKEKVRQAHALGMQVVPWTLNKSLHWGHFRMMGVDGIITDDPAALVRYLNPPKSGLKSRP